MTIIPVLNPDGLYKVAGTAERFTKADISKSQATQIAGRFNANKVDINRNFECKWKAKGVKPPKDFIETYKNSKFTVITNDNYFDIIG